MLAVIRELENWRHLLEGTKFKFKICMNYKNSEYFIKYIPGIKMEKIDGLSRRLDYKVKVERNNGFIV